MALPSLGSEAALPASSPILNVAESPGVSCCFIPSKLWLRYYFLGFVSGGAYSLITTLFGQVSFLEVSPSTLLTCPSDPLWAVSIPWGRPSFLSVFCQVGTERVEGQMLPLESTYKYLKVPASTGVTLGCEFCRAI